MLSAFTRLLRSRSELTRRPPAQKTGLAYWEDRARAYGPRAVLNLGHEENEFERVTRHQLETIFPHLARSLQGDERVALDFGCGPGRFTPHLARLIGGRAVGVDPTRTLVELAPAAPSVEYRVSDGSRIPIPDAAIDLAWVCLVLGGLSGAQLTTAARELDRVLRPGGLLFLVENTSSKEHCPHWTFRSVAEYQKLLPFAALAHLHDYDDLGERISILAGRKPESQVSV
jgi:ubiquinone/menaquinone biosynthesis C-methylase UbiE